MDRRQFFQALATVAVAPVMPLDPLPVTPPQCELFWSKSTWNTIEKYFQAYQVEYQVEVEA